jgi:aryl-phospho-beta-D-glucosidase BglC (GH1 family)
LVVLFAILSGLARQSFGAEAALSFLHTQGQEIVNESGKKVLLRGVGLGNWMLPEGYMWKFGDGGDRPRKIERIVADLIGPENATRFWAEFRKNYITQVDIGRIAQLGFNSVRPALNSRLFLTETEPPLLRDEGFVLLDNLIAWCKAQSVYVILDMHGAPGGQTGQNIDDSANDQPELFQQPKFQDQLVELWRAIARRYKDEPAVAGYDLLNEPLPARTGAEKAHKAQLEPLYQRLTRAIREVDPKHMIILEGADWANDWSVFSKPFDKNLIYQFHYYCWDNPTQLKSIQRYLDYRKRFGTPIWVGETGERDGAIYWATTEYFEANNIGWSFWPWKKMDTRNTPFSIKPPADWDKVASYSRGGPKPLPDVAQKAFDELLRNIRLESCSFFPDVVNALLRRAPARIEAENFGQEGAGKSYQVTDPKGHSAFYRQSEGVPITPQQGTGRRSGQFISLKAAEWTTYTIASGRARDYEVTVRGKAVGAPAEIQLSIGDQIRTVTLSGSQWSDLAIGTFTLAEGQNRLELRVRSGAADLDWLEVSLPRHAQQSSL